MTNFLSFRFSKTHVFQSVDIDFLHFSACTAFNTQKGLGKSRKYQPAPTVVRPQTASGGSEECGGVQVAFYSLHPVSENTQIGYKVKCASEDEQREK